MSGHSKWANIKHKKATQDAKKSKLFQKYTKEIMVAAKIGGSDLELNSRLRLAIDKAKAGNMPNDNIKKLLNRNDRNENVHWNEITYEGYAPNGIAIMVECLTDNINRTASFVKAIFRKSGGKLGTTGSVSYLFSLCGLIILDREKYNYDDVFELLIDKPIIDIIENDRVIEIQTKIDGFLTVKEELIRHKIDDFLYSNITKTSKERIELVPDSIDKVENLVMLLEEHEDIQNVYTNLA